MDAKAKNNAALGTEKISKLILRFTAATMSALLLNLVYSFFDAILVSWGVGDNAMGSVSVVFPFVLLQAAIATAVGAGAASIISIKLGENKRQEAGETTLNAMFIFYTSAIVITLLGLFFLEPVLQLMGVTAELLLASKQYLTIILVGNVFSTGFSSIIRAEGKMKYALLIWIIPVSINIIFDIVLIFVFKMGVAGSALGTVLGQFVSFLMSILFFVRFSGQVFKNARISPKTIGAVWLAGLPPLIQTAGFSLVTLVQNNMLSQVSGTLGVNTFAFVGRIISFVIVPFTAITQAAAPVIGYNYGKKDEKRVKLAIGFSLKVAYLYAAVSFFVLLLLSQNVLNIFTANTDIIAIGTKGLEIISLSILLIPFPSVTGAAFQASGNKKYALIMFAAQTVFVIPLSIGLSLVAGLMGIWWAYPVAYLGTNLVAIVLLYKQRQIM